VVSFTLETSAILWLEFSLVNALPYVKTEAVDCGEINLACRMVPVSGSSGTPISVSSEERFFQLDPSAGYDGRLWPWVLCMAYLDQFLFTYKGPLLFPYVGCNAILLLSP
jgi:hypothetical protein